MSVQVVCDECGLIGSGYEQPYDGGVSKPNGWGDVVAHQTKRYTTWKDLCPECFAKHKAAHPEQYEDDE